MCIFLNGAMIEKKQNKTWFQIYCSYCISQGGKATKWLRTLETDSLSVHITHQLGNVTFNKLLNSLSLLASVFSSVKGDNCNLIGLW